MDNGQSQQTKKRAEQSVSELERRRLLRGGFLYKKGNWWMLRYHLDFKDDSGRIVHARPSVVIGLCVGLQALTKARAEREAWDGFLSKVDTFKDADRSGLMIRA